MPLRTDRLGGGGGGNGGALVASAVAILEQKQIVAAPLAIPRRRPAAAARPPNGAASVSARSAAEPNHPPSEAPAPRHAPTPSRQTLLEYAQSEHDNPLFITENESARPRVPRTPSSSSASTTCTVIDTLPKEPPPPPPSSHLADEIRPSKSESQLQMFAEMDASEEKSGSRPLSTSSEASTACSDAVVNVCDGDSSAEDTSSTSDTDSSTDGSSSGREFVIMDVNGCFAPLGGLEPITEEERPVTANSTVDEDDSTCCDDDFQWISSSLPDRPQDRFTRNHSPDTKPDPSHPTSPPNHTHHTTHNLATKPPTTTRPSVLRTRSDNSPRRTDKSAPGSLDRRRVHPPNRQDRDNKSRSSHTLKEYRQSPPEEHREFHFPPPPPRCDLPPCQVGRYWNCCEDQGGEYRTENHAQRYHDEPSPSRYYDGGDMPLQTPPFRYRDGYWTDGYDCFHKHHERHDPKRYGSSSVLMECPRQEPYRLGSQPDLYGPPDADRRPPPPYSWRCAPRHDRDGCCTYHTLPPMSCCHHGWMDMDAHSYNARSYTKPGDQDERIKRLEGEKESLQMQVSVLSEQIEAQTDKIGELERLLTEKKQMLGNAEDLLQREMLSRSSLETQKLELMSAMSELKLQQAALERENVELRSCHYSVNGNHVQIPSLKKPPLIPRTSPVPQHTSTPTHPAVAQLTVAAAALSPSPSPISSVSTGGPSPIRSDDNQPRTPPPSYRRTVDVHYGSLPRQTFATVNGSVVDNNANSSQTNIAGVPTSASVPARKGVAFAETEKVVIEDTTDSMASYSPQASPSLQINKNKGIKKIFGKMKRSSSGNLEDLPGEGEFRRGGVRATAGPRLCWSQPQESTRPDKPFSEWDNDAICDWLVELGLDSYLIDVKRWVKDGAHLQAASAHDLEKELAIKNPLHRKKLQLAVLDMTDNGTSDSHLAAAGRLDTSWVLRWLDDTGLPQHKEAFNQARVDGRLLHRLTLDDLSALHVTSLLHSTSLRRGIQVLREEAFDPDCLVRRSIPGEPHPPEPNDIARWTAHRVMEWLRAVDLAEYAPNLRGAGVHGALMVHEPKFTAELMATLLSIPPSKTLLRRHLSTHFKELLGRDAIQEKREAETVFGYIPLTPAAKLKVAKKSQFSLKRKKSKGELDYGDLVCPLNTGNASAQSGELTASNGSSSHGDASGTKKKTPKEKDMAVYHLISTGNDDVFHANSASPLPQRLKDSILV